MNDGGHLHIIGLVSQKGGSGKSTLATNLAVAAAKAKKETMLLDLDPQRTAEQWYLSRDYDEPTLATLTSNQLPQAIERARASKIEWLFIDTPGRDEPSIAAAIRAADFCLIPCRPTPQDMKAIPPTAATLERLRKPFAFVLTQSPPRGSRSNEARSGLSILGPVCPVHIVSRSSFQDASGIGEGVLEFEPDGKAAAEIRSLWQWLSRHIAKVST